MQVWKVIKSLLFSLVLLLFLNGCNADSENQDLFQYKDSFVGDNSAVGNIVKQLQRGEHLAGFELKTKEKPYGIILNYDWSESENINKETAIYNATFIFALVQNADWVTFNFDNQEYTITKKDLQEWYGKELSEFKTEDELRQLIEEFLKNTNKVNQLL